MTASPVTHGLVLAAGYGRRMRPLTATTPKALIEVNGVALLDHAVRRLVRAGVTDVVVNVHYLADLVETHLKTHTRAMLDRMGAEARIHVSDEREAVLETGGGVKHALPLLGEAPFFVTNVDSFWLDAARPNLDLLAEPGLAGNERARLLLAPMTACVGYSGRGDFTLDREGGLSRRGERDVAPYAYSGTLLTRADAFEDMPDGQWSLNTLFDAGLAEHALRAVPLEGTWLHVGTPEAIAEAEATIAASLE